MKYITTAVLVICLFSVAVFADEELPPGPVFGEEQPPITPVTSFDNTLKISEVQVKVDGEKDRITTSGSKIQDDAKEQSQVDFDVEIQNTFDKEISNIDVTVTIEDIDDGDDIDDSTEISKLVPGSSTKKSFDFDIPLQVDEDTYTVLIEAEGKDADNNIHTLSWTLKLDVNKDKHNVVIQRATISPATIACSRTANFDVSIINLGSENEDIELRITNENLGINALYSDIQLGTGTDDDSEFDKTYRLEIGNDIRAGTYPIQLKVEYNDGKSVRTKDATIFVEDCSERKQASVVNVQKTMSGESAQPVSAVAQPTNLVGNSNEEAIVFALTLILIVLLGLVLFLLGIVLMRRR